MNIRKRALPLICASIGVMVALLGLTGTVKIYRIPTGSMSPTIQPGDHVLASRLFNPAKLVTRGQLVIFDSSKASPRNSGKYVQRVIAVAGDKVDLIDGRLYVNGQPLPEINGKVPHGPGQGAINWPRPGYPLVIPEGKIFTLGDNYDNSLDSRYFGPFPVDAVTHSPDRVILPLSRAGKIE